MSDPYQVLGISSTATDEEVKAAYRRLAKQYHPDRNNGSAEAEKKMMQINDAYAEIMDIRKNGGHSTRSGSSSSSGYQNGYSNSYGGGANGYGNPYNDFFGGFWGQGYGSSGQARQGAPQFAMVRQYLSSGRYHEAMQLLQSMSDGSAEWYYLAGRAHQGMGDDIAALNYARQAANMEPMNMEYTSFVRELTQGGNEYRRQGTDFGGVANCLCSNPCLTCMLFNLCCGGSGCGWRFCCI